MSSIVAGVVRALLGGLLDYLEQRRQEAALKKLGRMEERYDALERKIVLAQNVRDIEHRLATDPEYSKRMRDAFARSKRS